MIIVFDYMHHILAMPLCSSADGVIMYIHVYVINFMYYLFMENIVVDKDKDTIRLHLQ